VKVSQVVTVNPFTLANGTPMWICVLSCGHTRTIPASEAKPTKLKCPQCTIKP